MKRLIGAIMACGLLAASLASAAEPVSHPNPDQKAAQKKAKKAMRKNAKGRKAVKRKAHAKKVAK